MTMLGGLLFGDLNRMARGLGATDNGELAGGLLYMPLPPRAAGGQFAGLAPDNLNQAAPRPRLQLAAAAPHSGPNVAGAVPPRPHPQDITIPMAATVNAAIPFNDPNDPSRINPLTIWPVPGHGALNPGNAATGEGEGHFGAPRRGSTHTGIDITAPEGTPVYAAGDGTIFDIQPNPSDSYGIQTVIDHGDGLYTQYSHINEIVVNPGDAVRAGQFIGWSGRTGNPPPRARAHLHYEVREGSPYPRTHPNGATIADPLGYQAYRGP